MRTALPRAKVGETNERCRNRNPWRAYAEYFSGFMGHVNTEDGSKVSIRLLHEEDSTEQMHEIEGVHFL